MKHGGAIVITGASKGLGAVLAGYFAEKGANLALCARRKKSLDKLAASLSGDVITAACDVSNFKDAKKFAALVEKRFKTVDLLINNASILGPRTPLEKISPKDWAEVIDIDLNSIFYMTRAMLPLMGKGSMIINISSGVTSGPRENWGPYAIAKYGLEALSNNFAVELKGRGIRVNIVDPGAMRTDMRREAYPEEDPETLNTPEEKLGVFRYLVSAEAASITGKRFSAKDFIQR